MHARLKFLFGWFQTGPVPDQAGHICRLLRRTPAGTRPYGFTGRLTTVLFVTADGRELPCRPLNGALALPLGLDLRQPLTVVLRSPETAALEGGRAMAPFPGSTLPAGPALFTITVVGEGAGLGLSLAVGPCNIRPREYYLDTLLDLQRAS